LERDHPRADVVGRVVEDAELDMRCAGLNRNAVGAGDSRHFQRRFQISRPIVNAGEQMAVKVDHSKKPLKSKRLFSAIYAADAVPGIDSEPNLKRGMRGPQARSGHRLEVK
jgi:hypothetical protein